MGERQTESRAEIVVRLEQRTGRTLRTRAEIQAYVREVAAHRAADRPSVRRWLQVKKFTLIALLAFSFMQYYMLDVLLEITSMHSTVFFVPARAPVLLKSAIHALG
ncbi:MAG TPA: hypothetical protein VLF42_14910 [Burkholderiales bacterium]|nr:hypothetical protein [Burkholderiales bacterium]